MDKILFLWWTDNFNSIGITIKVDCQSLWMYEYDNNNYQ